MSQEIVLITGGNTGIGLEGVKALLGSNKSYYILLGSRKPANADSAIAQLKTDFPDTSSTLEGVQIDITDDESIKSLYETVKDKFGKVDVLINNAGVCFDSTMERDIQNPRALFQNTYDVNVSGTQAFTIAFAPLLIQSSAPRLLFLTSSLSTLTNTHKALMPEPLDLTKGWPKKDGLFINLSYRASKAALNMVMISWYHILRPDGVKVWAVSPGFLATGLSGVGPEALRARGAGDAKVAGDLLIKVIEGERDADVGKVVHQNGNVQPW